MRSRSHEALGWSLFAAGGVVAALFIPAMIAVTGIAGAVGWDAISGALSHGGNGVGDLLRHAPVRALIGLVVALAAVFSVHRIRHLLIDLHVPVPHVLLAVVSYAGALAITLLAAVFLALI